MNNSTLKGIDYVEFYVANSYQAAHFYKSTMGFDIVAYGGPETGLADKKSYIIEQGTIRFILSSPIETHSLIHQHIVAHDDGVRDITFSSSNVKSDFKRAIDNGACPILSPIDVEDHGIKVRIATITCFGDTLHTFIQREKDERWVMPFYRPFTNNKSIIEVGLLEIDHIAIALEKGQLSIWKEFYQNVLGFQLTHKEDVYTEYSGMNSLVMSNSTGTIKFPLVEPAQSSKKSQIDSYLESYGGSGVQHIALRSKNIIQAAQTLKAQGIEFLNIPASYYDNVSEDAFYDYREKLSMIKELGILIDRDQKGLLMQIFSKPLQNRPTFFVEIIQRDNREGFGSQNIKALFEAIEENSKAIDKLL